MAGDRIASSRMFRVLVVGFSSTIVLLVAAAAIAVQNARLIRESATGLANEQLVTTRLVNELQTEQQTINAAFYRLSRGPDALDRQRVLAQLDETDRIVKRIVADASQTPEAQSWRDLDKAVSGFSTEARRLLALKNVPAYSTRDLFRRHEQVTRVAATLIAGGFRRASFTEQLIERRSARLVRDSLLLLGGCLLAALACSVVTVRMTAQIFQRMQWQADELSRVSWYLLEGQETTARRFSHELHDELGQSLTAVKANLRTLEAGGRVDPARIEDCNRLVDEAIRNVRELSQLLRPIILDDFGLDAGLRWLCETFTQRTHIEVDYRSNFSGRLPDETETHMFRIVQEALTNVARHSGATKVAISTQAAGERIQISIHDNGKGLQTRNGDRGMGMIGMRARARSAAGELAVNSKPGEGVTIDVWAPMHGRDGRQEQEAHDSHPAG